ncbi:MAG: phosphotriesterase-related protein [Thermoleophilaceae bacterium]|nr:phosphotriesterase-related protein [Thermoleophilaceae bacterium]
MPQVETTAGPIDADQLGKTLIHEHFRAQDEAVAVQWPHVHDEDAEYALALESANGVIGHGVKTVVEPTGMLLGRDVRVSKRIADDTGLQIVVCTGIYTYEYLPQFLANRDADAIAELFVHDIEEGIQGTEIKAALIKCAADEPGVTENIEKVHRAAARASVRTGAPIMAHSRPAANTGPRQVEIFLEEGVAPEKVQIAHTGDTDDLDYIDGLLDKGVYIGLDRYGLDIFLPTEKRNATVLALLERGHVDRMFLSQDYAVGIDWYPPAMIPSTASGGNQSSATTKSCEMNMRSA